VQVRKHHSSSLKKGKYAKHSIEMEEVMSNSLNVSVGQTLMHSFLAVPETHGQVRQRGGQDSWRSAKVDVFEIGFLF